MSALLLMILKSIQELDEQQQRAQEDFILKEKTAFRVKRGNFVLMELLTNVETIITLDMENLYAHPAKMSLAHMEKYAKTAKTQSLAR